MSIEQTQPVQKTYTQRFQELEGQVGTMVKHYLEANQAFNVASTIIQEMSAQIRLLNDQLQAVYDLHEAGSSISRDAVANIVNQKRVDRIQEILTKDESAGLIKKIDSVTSTNDIVVYTAPDTALAFKAVGNFQEEGLSDKLMGAKVGDTVSDVNITGIYQIVQQATPATPPTETVQ